MELHIEGMDCSGKSSSISELEKKAPLTRRHRILAAGNPFITSFREMQQQHPWNSPEVTNELLNAIRHDIQNYVPSTGFIVQESTLITKGYAMRIVDGMPRNLYQLFEELLDTYPSFDFSVYMTVDEDVRIERLRKRLESGGRVTPNDQIMIDDPERFRKIDKVMLGIARTAFDAVILDTTKMTPDDIVNELLSIKESRYNEKQ